MKMKVSSGFLASFLMLFFVLLPSCSSEEPVGNEPDINAENKLAQFNINTNGGTIVDEPKILADLRVSENGQVTYNGSVGIEFRGASSQALFPKKSYGLETRDGNNEDIDVSLLGFPEEEDWILYGPYSDKTLMRNLLIYDLSRAMNRYASRTKYVELILNDNYQGVYVFMEKLKRDVNRIAINKLNPTENTGDAVTGGYILKIDKLSGSNLGSGYNDLNSFKSSYSPNNASGDQDVFFLYEYPDAEDITPEQKAYISNYISDFEDALASSNFKDPDLGYQAYIDVLSFIDFFLLNELSNNIDAYRLSTFMHKDRNGKLIMGPIWDFNLAFGNASYCSGGDTGVWSYKFNERCPDDFWLVPFWWERFLEDENFVNQLKNRWNTLRAGIFSDSYIFTQIDNNIEVLRQAGAIDSNFSKWNIIGSYVWPNNFVGNTYDEETIYLKNWMSNRLSWLDTNINGL